MSMLHGLDDVVNSLSAYERFLLDALLAQREAEGGKPLAATDKRQLAEDFVSGRQEKEKSEKACRRKAMVQRRARVSEARSREFTWAPSVSMRKPGRR